MLDEHGQAKEYSREYLQGLVKDWMEAFEVKVDLELQESLIVEEVYELIDVVMGHLEPTIPTIEALSAFLKESADVYFVLFGYSQMLDETGETFSISDDTKKILAVAFDMVAGIVLLDPVVNDQIFGEAFERVVASNMTKLGDDGKPVRNEAGKVIKGPNYVAPYLTDLAERLSKSLN
jgi:NTP pyrophosphatase (non-canonical NTP hydrolase)